ncbi:MAG: S4 domain-containing protein [Calditerrivibrio sp.]|nr:S4 domain-containing protein [Calditerrivibrio sp.]
MRLDKFLKVLSIVKRRTVANEVSSEGSVFVNDRPAKPSYKVKEGDIIKLRMWNYEKVIRVIAVPRKIQIKKSEINSYIELISYKTLDSRDIILPQDEELF